MQNTETRDEQIRELVAMQFIDRLERQVKVWRAIALTFAALFVGMAWAWIVRG